MKLLGLHAVADRASDRQQSLYLGLVLAEYAALLLVSLVSVNMIPDRRYIVLYGALLGAALATLVVRSVLKPEQRWYQARALAESVKTISWKFAMGARPFKHDVEDRHRLHKILRQTIDVNRGVSLIFARSGAVGRQITGEMNALRELPWSERLDVYIKERVEDQLDWYNRKAKSNAAAGSRFAVVLGCLYVLAFVVFLLRMEQPQWIYAHPDPLILLGASVLGWMQIKRFNELGASYSLTAAEIAILRFRAQEIADDADLSIFIDDAEEAFSREHTQWLARRSVLRDRPD